MTKYYLISLLTYLTVGLLGSVLWDTTIENLFCLWMGSFVGSGYILVLGENLEEKKRIEKEKARRLIVHTWR